MGERGAVIKREAIDVQQIAVVVVDDVVVIIIEDYFSFR